MNTFLSFRSALLPSTTLLGALLVASLASGCDVTEGADDRASFSYVSLGPLSDPLAVGASDGLSISVPSGTVVDHATSSDPSVLSLGPLASTGDSGSYSASINGVKPGSVTVTIYDASSKEIDHTTLQVADTASISLDAASGTTLLAGESFTVHGTTLGQGGVTLAGSGAVSFAFQGMLTSASDPGALCTGDCGSFLAGAPGDGQVLASAPGATATVGLHVVPTTAIDSFTLGSQTLKVAPGASATTSYSLAAAGTRVHSDGSEITCTSSSTSVAQVSMLRSDDIVGDTSTLVQVTGGAAGSATITCTVGSRQASLAVTVQ